MGNSMSENEDEGNADCSRPVNPDDNLSDGEDDSDEESKPLTDLWQLFGDSSTLRAAATKVKEKVPENVILQNHDHIMNWLVERQERSENSVTLAQFCDMMMSQNVERPDAIKAFHQLDCDGSGVADVETMKIAIDTYYCRGTLGELGKSIRILQSCSQSPGFVDLYTGNIDPLEKHGLKMLKYLVRNRVDSKAIPFPSLSSFYNIHIMRSSVLKSSLISCPLTEKDPEIDVEWDDFEKRIVDNCYNHIEVSSNTKDSQLLRHPTLYWQSNSGERSHWIRIHIKPHIIIKQLSIGVASGDQSYMPEHVTVSVGQSHLRMRHSRDVKILNQTNGQAVLLKNMKVHYNVVQINIRRCHDDGCDTRVHGIQVTGYKQLQDAAMSVTDASALWYLQMLTSTIQCTLPMSPGLKPVLMAHTKKALEIMPPLSLSIASPDKPAFLNRHVLQEIESFAAILAKGENPDNPCLEGLLIQLGLNLARGSITPLLNLMTSMIAMKELSLPCVDLLSKALAARSVCWEKFALALSVKCLGSDGGVGPMNIGPEAVLESQPSANSRDGNSSSSSGRMYTTEEGKTSCTMIFKSEENIQLAKIRLQVASGLKGHCHGLVFVYNPESIDGLSNKFDFDEHIRYFSKYDFWGETEFKFSIGYRDSGLGGLADNPVAFFSFDQDISRDELEVSVRWSAVGRYVMVKFLDDRTDITNRIGILSVKLFGLQRPSPWCRDIEKSVIVSNNPKKTSCSLPEIVHVILTFISDIGIDQMKKKRHSKMPFLDMSDLDVMVLWNTYLKCTSCHQQALSDGSSSKVVDQWLQSSILALQLIHGLIPALAASKASSQASRDSLFEELCGFINIEVDENGPDKTQPKLDSITSWKQKIAQQTIVDGAPLFFPEKTKKRNELFKLLEFISDHSSKPSTSLVFQSLCQYFSTVDPKGLLELPFNPPKDFSPASALSMMKSFLLVTCQETSKSVISAAALKTSANSDDNKKNAQNLQEPKLNSGKTNETVCEGGDHSSLDSEKKESDSSQAKGEPENADGLKGEEIQATSSGSETTEANTSEEKKQMAKEKKDSEQTPGHGMSYLVKLVASLQAALMTWCCQQLDNLSTVDHEEQIKTVNHIVTSYTKDIMENAFNCLEMIKDLSEDEMKLKLDQEREPSFLCNIFRQQCLFLSFLVDKVSTETRVALLNSCKKVLTLISQLSKTNPSLFANTVIDKDDQTKTEETVLRTWEIESPHEYLNHSNITETFHCPGASKIVIDFDSNCETERRYDYLEFIDAKGLKMHFDHKVGTEKWPLQVTFSGPYVNFLFHSDSSNTEWGYKFKVSAKGSPDTPVPWMTDLNLGLVKVLGQLCGATLASNPSLADESASSGKDDNGEQDILRSDLWTSLFRGGYRAVGRLQRSLSGKFTTGDDSEIHLFLLEVVGHLDAVGEEEGSRPLANMEDKLRKQVIRFCAKCREADPTKAQVKPGGVEVNKALLSLFVALVWHCQQLREDVDKFLQAGEFGEISEGIAKAYKMAESLRIQLASQRQQWNAADDKDESLDPAALLASKSMFLLKFAGLTKVQLKNELRSKYYKQLMLKKAGNKPVLRNEVMDKYPSFKLVMEFVQDPAWTSQRVHQLLQERTEFASATRDVYMFSAEVIRILSSGHPFQVSVVLFLQETFAYQNKFASHYADGVDGCGLEQESQVRRAYYTLVRILVDAFNKHKNDDCQQQSSSCEMICCCLLHLLDIEWQPYDLTFVKDLNLPDLYFTIAKETVKMRDLIEAAERDEEELKEYKQAMEWYDEVSHGLNAWFRQKEEDSKDDKKAIKMFIARFSDVLDVEISCDGCNMTLPGRRYRCLQCLDMDLCTACFSGGVEPEEHRDDHEIVHLVYKCNHCQAFIMGKRIHCNQCDDFDLCLGCHTKKKFPSGHSEDHDVTEFPMVKLTTSKISNSPLRSYIHQHSWLLYTSLTLTLSDLVYGQEKSFAFLDPDYIRTAGQLQNQCVALATQCLQRDVDVEKEKILTHEVQMEESFARHSQERIIGLLGAVMPLQEKQNEKAGQGFNFWTQEFLDLLLRVSKGEHSHELNTQHLALRLMGRLLLSTEVPVSVTPPGAAAAATVSDNKQFVAGKETISHLFSYGAKEFERHGLEWACSVARMLEMLFASPQWRLVINSHITQCVQSLYQKVDMACIFPLFVIAGFPEVLTTGTLVEYSSRSIETQKGVVLKHFPDKYQTLVVDLSSRKRHTVKDQWVSCLTDSPGRCEAGSLSQFVDYVIFVVSKMKNGEEMSVECLWALSLAVKVVDQCLKEDSDTGGIVDEVSTIAFVQALVFLACKGTSLNHHWLLRDLEVLSLIWNTQDGNTGKKMKRTNLKDRKGKKKRMNKGKNNSKDSDEDNMAMLEDDDDDNDYRNRRRNSDNSSSSSSSDDESDDDDDDDDDDVNCFDMDDDEVDADGDDDTWWETTSNSASDKSHDWGEREDEKDLWESIEVDPHMKELLVGLGEELNFDSSILLALYTMYQGDQEEVLKCVIENATNKDVVTEFIKQWKEKKPAAEDGKKDPTADVASIDMGISSLTNVNTHHKIPEVAEEEKGLNLQNLFTHQDKLEGAIRKKQRGWSSALFKKEVEKHGRSGSRVYLHKINMAMCVLYARHTLTSLLAQWPELGPSINSSLMGCKDVKQIPCVLDLLYKIDTRDFFSKVVDRVIHLCDASSLVAIAYTAAQFMKEGTISALTRESSHSYTSADRKRGQITLPGASYLTVTFDSRCATAEEDSLMFSPRQQMMNDTHTFSGQSRDCWSSFQIPGDTLYFKFVLSNSDHDEENLWGYKFTVTAGTRDSFETGHTILDNILSSVIARSFPLGQLWSSLVYVSVKQAGVQRLKAIHLMLKILALQRKADQEDKSKTTPDIDICILRPLWELYESLTPETEDNTKVLQPAVVGALTDLFLRVEELASEWEITEPYLVSLISAKHLQEAFVKGLKNVIKVSEAISWQSASCQALQSAKPESILKVVSDKSKDPQQPKS